MRLLASGASRTGRFGVTWDLRDQRGRAVPNGAYLVSLRAGGERCVRRLSVLR